MWILNCFPIFCVLLIASMIYCLFFSVVYEEEKNKKKSTIYSILSFASMLLFLACISTTFSKSSEEYETPPYYKVYIRQIGSSNMFVKDGRSGNTVAKYQVLTENGEYREFTASDTRIIFSDVKKPYIQVYRVEYTKFLGKLIHSQFEGTGYNNIYIYSLVVPESSVDNYIRINY